MTSFSTRWFSPCFLLVCTLLQGCSVFELGTAGHSTLAVDVPDGTWLERCLPARADLDTDQRPWMVAVLSPRMPYSLLEWPRMQRAAIAMGFRIRVWQDPLVLDAEWQAALASAPMAGWDVIQANQPPMDCLAGWLPINHFPYVRVLKGGRVHPWPIWGVMPDLAWRAVLNNRLATFKPDELEPR